ncbi:MAG: efflux RND transporter periplasmic adaptor subunit [Desulfocapsaceae bacterium]|nr:efflux RND transporter periplasmic adaptor subunit [Desulfocapsaceae bacterium]
MIQQLRRQDRLLVFLFCLLALTGCKEKRKADSQIQALVPVQTYIVQAEESASSMEIAATVQAAERAVIAARISGHITQIPVIPGSKVRTGDLLIRINAAEISMQLQQARTRLDQVQRNYEREKRLLAKDASTPETVKTLEENRRIALASVQEAQTMLDYATITAPFSGVITKKNVSPGDLAMPGSPLLEIEGQQALQVVANIPESIVLRMRIGEEIPISIPSAGLSGTGRVVEISPAADPLSRTVPIKLSLPNLPDIRSGQFARLLLPHGTESALFVPASAIIPFGQMERIFVIQADKARLRLVRTGSDLNGRVEILAGLSPGDEIVIAGGRLLEDGQAITRQADSPSH